MTFPHLSECGRNLNRNSHPKKVDSGFELADGFSEWRDVDRIFRHDTSEISRVVNGVISSDVEMRQFVKGRMIVQHEGNERGFRMGVVTVKSQHS